MFLFTSSKATDDMTLFSHQTSPKLGRHFCIIHGTISLRKRANFAFFFAFFLLLAGGRHRSHSANILARHRADKGCITVHRKTINNLAGEGFQLRCKNPAVANNVNKSNQKCFLFSHVGHFIYVAMNLCNDKQRFAAVAQRTQASLATTQAPI